MAETAKTKGQIEALKQDWTNDPCWDIEDTEGFEAHRVELLAFRLQKEAEWTAAREASIRAGMQRLKIDSRELYDCLVGLIDRVQRLEQRLCDLEK